MDGQDIWVIEFTNSFCLTKKAAIKIFLHLCVHIGTRQKDFDGYLLLCRGFLGQEYCAGSPITQQFFNDARAEHLTNKMMSPGCGHAGDPLKPLFARASKYNTRDTVAAIKRDYNITKTNNISQSKFESVLIYILNSPFCMMTCPSPSIL